ncbi:MAG: hypothetical protein HY013_02210 [Candidatus Solibacter usitatus]|nr:hypothetical protein [Candidatus Solibacter usitatus]
MKVGAEPRKIAILAVLLAVAGALYYVNVLSGPESAPAPSTPRPKQVSAPAPSSTPPAPAAPIVRRARGGREASEEFRPSLKFKPEERPDVTRIDPTLRLDLLAKVQAVESPAGARSVFAFSSPPAPPAPKVEVGKIPVKTPEQIKAEQAKVAAAGKAPEPPPPPINLKFYGYSTPRRDGVKRAFFLDGEDIFVAEEGELIKRRYKLIRIGVNSVVMEDTQFKNQQTLIIQQEQAG